MKDTTTIEQIKKNSQSVSEAIHSLLKQLNKNHKPLSNWDVQNMFNTKNCFFFAAMNSKDKIVGMITLIVYRTPYTKKAVLEDIVVDKKFRRQGIGTKLIGIAINKARKEGAFFVDFTSRPSRRSANQLYKKLGFEQRKTNMYRLQL